MVSLMHVVRVCWVQWLSFENPPIQASLLLCIWELWSSLAVRAAWKWRHSSHTVYNRRETAWIFLMEARLQPVVFISIFCSHQLSADLQLYCSNICTWTVTYIENAGFILLPIHYYWFLARCQLQVQKTHT